MEMIKSYKDYINESFVYESKEEQQKSKIHPELDMPQRHDWVEKIIMREYFKGKDNEWQQANEDGDDKKVEEIREKVMKDPKFGPELKKHIEDDKQFQKLVKEAGAEDGAGLDKKQIDEFAKKNPKGFQELIELQAKRNVKLTEKPGGILQLTTQDMEGGELQAEAIRQKMTAYIKKNGKPKGMIIDNRSNTGGAKNPSEAIADFFTKDDEYPIEVEQFNYGPRKYKTLEEYMNCYEDADGNKSPWDPEVGDYVNNLKTEKEKQDFWKKSVKSGKFELPNNRKNMVSKEDRLTDIPIVLQTSIRTFSSGEFASETLKNINPNVIHIGHNSGGGGNRTALGTDQKDWNNFDKSRVEQAQLAADAFATSYADADQGTEVKKQIDEWIKSEGQDKINKMSGKDLAAELKKKIKAITNDDHVEIKFLNKPEGEGKDMQHGIQVEVPQVGAARALRDPITKELIRDKDGNVQYKGAWEKLGTMASGTSAAVESDPNTATKDALEYLYKKTGQTKLAEDLKKDPEKFGLTKDGKDGIFDDTMPSKQSAYVNGGAQRQVDQHKISKETAKQNAKEGLMDKIFKTELEFKKDVGKEEIKTIKDTGTVKLLNGLDPKIAKAISDMKVVVSIPGGKQKSIKTKTLMDFVPVDINDPEEKAMIQAQIRQYNRVNALRLKQKLEPLVDFNIWLKRNIELAKDNLGFQARLKAKAEREMKAVSDAKADKIEQAAAAKAKAEQAKAAQMKAAQAAKMKAAKAKAAKKPAVKENFVYSFDQFLVEEENNRVFESITQK